MADDSINMPLSKQDRTYLLAALKTLAGAESTKYPNDFSRARLDELHDLARRIGEAAEAVIAPQPDTHF